jgi:hypothetical protein
MATAGPRYASREEEKVSDWPLPRVLLWLMLFVTFGIFLYRIAVPA